MNDKIIWVFSIENPMSIPSYIVGGIMPADYLKIKKIIFLKDHNPKKFLLNHQPKLIIIGKAFHNGIIELAKEAKILGIKVISIFDDWHFENNNHETLKRSQINLELAKLSEISLTKTKSASDLICKNINITPKIIPDCIRYKSLEVVSNFDYPFNISWFGNYTNHKTIIKGINELVNSKHKFKLQIISNKLDQLKLSLNNINKNIPIDYIEWSLDLSQHIINSNIIIIPLLNNNKSLVKSSNRIVDSLNMGRFVIISDNEQFKEFKEYCFFGDIGQGLNWLKNNDIIANKMIKSGQNYVVKNYSLQIIADKWKSIINSLGFKLIV